MYKLTGKMFFMEDFIDPSISFSIEDIDRKNYNPLGSYCDISSTSLYENLRKFSELHVLKTLFLISLSEQIDQDKIFSYDFGRTAFEMYLKYGQKIREFCKADGNIIQKFRLHSLDWTDTKTGLSCNATCDLVRLRKYREKNVTRLATDLMTFFFLDDKNKDFDISTECLYRILAWNLRALRNNFHYVVGNYVVFLNYCQPFEIRYFKPDQKNLENADKEIDALLAKMKKDITPVSGRIFSFL